MSLSGTYRTTYREMAAMVQCRSKLKLSMNQIAELFGRSRQTVHRYVKYVGVDNRRRSDSLRRHLTYHFKKTLGTLKLRVKMYIVGLADFKTAIKCRMVPLVTLDWFLESENCYEQEEEDPA